MEIIAAAIVSVCDEKCADEKETVNQLFRLQCQGNLACGLCDFSIQNVSARIERIVDEDGSPILDFAELGSASKWYLSDEMVPYIDENALEGSAEAFFAAVLSRGAARSDGDRSLCAGRADGAFCGEASY